MIDPETLDDPMPLILDALSFHRMLHNEEAAAIVLGTERFLQVAERCDMGNPPRLLGRPVIVNSLESPWTISTLP